MWGKKRYSVLRDSTEEDPRVVKGKGYLGTVRGKLVCCPGRKALVSGQALSGTVIHSEVCDSSNGQVLSPLLLYR